MFLLQRSAGPRYPAPNATLFSIATIAVTECGKEMAWDANIGNFLEILYLSMRFLAISFNLYTI